ncbi:hypothetical protein PROFUN_02496 [Planoprotostelium fungivorum]|uniref:Uncharacterized protein n=1 Tax=Planoprotostelium fungivorum TaxID=1890364 RepID=A0A2P6MP74_9EUKA|nr:hypothetical protein PROFUN_02496 [Planoprotostelium fungivorum]
MYPPKVSSFPPPLVMLETPQVLTGLATTDYVTSFTMWGEAATDHNWRANAFVPDPNAFYSPYIHQPNSVPYGFAPVQPPFTQSNAFSLPTAYPVQANGTMPSTMTQVNPPFKRPIQSQQQEASEKQDRSRLSTNRFFHLHQQPLPTQRKSYKSENRCLLPNPLVLYPSEPKEGVISDAVVSVRLVSDAGLDLPEVAQQCLVSTDGTELQDRPIREKTKFRLKITETSEGEAWRLLFHVEFKLQDKGSTTQECVEDIVTDRFIVKSKRRNRNKEEQ